MLIRDWGLALWDQCTPDQTRAMVSSLSYRRFRMGERIFSEGDKKTQCFILFKASPFALSLPGTRPLWQGTTMAFVPEGNMYRPLEKKQSDDRKSKHKLPPIVVTLAEASPRNAMLNATLKGRGRAPPPPPSPPPPRA